MNYQIAEIMWNSFHNGLAKIKIASRTTGARGSNILETSNNILLHRTKFYKI